MHNAALSINLPYKAYKIIKKNKKKWSVKKMEVLFSGEFEIVEAVSKKGNKYKALYITVDGAKKMLCFVDNVMELKLYRYGIL